MAVKKLNIRSALSDLGFLVVAFIAGIAGAGWLVAGLLYAAAIFAWWWTRRHALAQMTMRLRLTQGAIALVMLGVVMGLFYWLGLALGGHL